MKTWFLMSLLIASTLVPDAISPVTPSAVAEAAPRRNFFLPVHDLSDWEKSPGALPGEVVLTSPLLTAPVAWNELVVSWNAALPAGAYLKAEASTSYDQPAKTTKFYSLGDWSSDVTRHPRGSVNNQKDADGNVETDTLVMNKPGGAVRLRFTLGADEKAGLTSAGLAPLVRFVGLAFTDKKAVRAPEAPNKAAWGKTVYVPERFQMDFKDQGGAVWCSPTSVSMILAHWSDETKRDELTMTVPQVAHSVHDPQWPGTGNWAFNVAFAGSFSGVRAYVTRFDGLTELEDWIASGVPVALSVNYGLLKGDADKGGGHLVVCNGFTKNGDVIIADPGRNPLPGEKFRVFPRANVVAGWGASGNTVYLIYPEGESIPVNSMQHWDSLK